jgi:hypothetical protein
VNLFHSERREGKQRRGQRWRWTKREKVTKARESKSQIDFERPHEETEKR